MLDDAAADRPADPAVRDSRGGWDYRRVVELSHAVERWLADNGVDPGDRVIVQLPNRRETVPIVYGVSRRGAVLVPLNPGMKPFHLRSVLGDSEPALVLVSGQAGDAARENATVPVHDIDDVWADVEARVESSGSPGSSGPSGRDEPAGARGEDVAILIYTSGSTAAPKAVVCPHARVVFAASAINAVLGYRPGDVVFCRPPMSFDYGLYQIFLSALGRAELVLAGDEPDLVLLKQIRECGATVVPIVPSLGSMIATLARRAPGSAPAVRMFTNTGAALPAATIANLHESFPGARVVRMYGITECKRVTIMEPELDRERPGASGRPLPGTRVLILDDAGRPLPAGEVGEIVVDGPNVMAGYWRDPELSARAYRPDPETGRTRLHTGDYGWLDQDGYLYFEGRRDDMFKRRGTRMSTVEIEAAAMDIPGVRAAVALPPAGERDLVVFVEGELDPHAVLRELALRLEPPKVPAACHVLDRFPLTLNGKNERKQLTLLLEGSAP
ncbi:acyl-CoA synthetase (AMP-forming)/AMP-acid ligase II [Streptosporangium becharense]|uniref:Acyl-CoA synthetase (AMP-forming)/AMP-acid ligase II n=1 Tax=Streptosporangium becharense TaxID=1816182 RepID=A0A7W9MFA0_9ACTN|nr:AMP-binding protein [Streptosporangium becharense]MBB2913062.1 acyl-CoA synthetase (AMP-forming)/AMP-acid ligase II [Streptosporangium becharense]MBB5818113.1 acyl-CoA synthetase (AMP-forming)/AMP-acid ligase II [Streptosporangium becharense]